MPTPRTTLSAAQTSNSSLQLVPGDYYARPFTKDGSILPSLAWRNKSFGQGISFAWGPDSNTYTVLETRLKPKLFKNVKERPGMGLKAAGAFAFEALYPGPLLAGRGSGFVIFWDWQTGEIVRRIDVGAKNVFWSGTGSLMCISSDGSFYGL